MEQTYAIDLFIVWLACAGLSAAVGYVKRAAFGCFFSASFSAPSVL